MQQSLLCLFRAVAVGFVQLLASMLSGLLIDTVGRIPLLITSSVFMSLALASFGSYVHYDENTGSSGNNDWIPLLCVLIFTIAFSLGLNILQMKFYWIRVLINLIIFAGISPISWLLIGELFPLEYRGIGSSIATSFSYFCAFLAVKTFVDFQVIKNLNFFRENNSLKADKSEINFCEIPSIIFICNFSFC